MQVLMGKEDIRDSLGISLATVNNWIKTSIIPSPDCGDRYSEKTYSEIVERIKNANIKLNGRANRSRMENKYVSYLGIKDKYRKQLLDSAISMFEESDLSIHEGVIALLISMLEYNNLFVEGSKIHGTVLDWIKQLNTKPAKMALFSKIEIKNEDDDFLGAFYQSIQSIASKSTNGAYYTPAELLTSIKVRPNMKIMDPCCGSGGILLKVLTKQHDPSAVYARDVDPVALQICTANLVLFFDDPNMEANVDNIDLLFIEDSSLFFDTCSDKYDWIVTNPPWGSRFSKQQKDLLLSLYPELSTSESFSIALYRMVKMLSDGGELHCFLPHSFLNVSTHRNIRRHILDCKYQIEIKLLGKAFKGVLSEAILLVLKNCDDTSPSIEVEGKNEERYLIRRSDVESPDYIIAATASRSDGVILDKIFSAKYLTLSGEADFGLGIVTGSNKDHVSNKRTDTSEPIFRGKDIAPYKYLEPECFIEFRPNAYQQVAPLRYYRTRKIVYRFICDRIICAIDENNSLILNSANLFIPHKYPMETIVCLFNSCIYSYIYRKRFHSSKVLKTHIQSLPLPRYSKEEHDLFAQLYSKIREGAIEQESIDLEISKYFCLTAEDYIHIKGSIDGITH
ncbi:MAG TPA: TaqI-like C-terminal specificity domain-containing protein [Rectinemataceae bacterium]|nr:TaqI-like C-terminal specificity domain-containing protein [Rectinemataceae bacterium]